MGEITKIANKINIHELDLNNVQSNSTILLIAKRGSGKSTLIKSLLHHFRDIPTGIIICPSERMDPYYSDFFPSAFIYYEYKSETIVNLLQRQIEIIAKNKRRIENGKKEIDTRAVLVMDDCLAEKKLWEKDKPLIEIFVNGRHYRILYILVSQNIMGVGPQLRDNCDIIFFFAVDNDSQIKKIYEHYAGMFPSYDVLKQVIDELTKDYGTMVIVKRGKRDSIIDKVFYYKAPIVYDEPFMVGCNQFKTYHKLNYNNDNSFPFKMDKNLFKNIKKTSFGINKV